MIPQTLIVVMIIAILAGFIIPAILGLYCKKKFKVVFRPFLTGCIMFFVFAVVLGPLVQGVILSTTFGAGIQGNLFLAAVFLGLCAGLFEEGAKLFAFKYFLNKDLDNDYNAIMYGAGQGGFEAFYLLISQVITPLFIAIMVNSGKTESLLLGQSEEGIAAINEAIDSVINLPASTFVWLIVSRIPYILLCFALTMFVWYAVKKEQYSLFLIAVFMHTMFYAGYILMMGIGSSVLVIELTLMLISAAYLFVAFLLYKNEHMGEKIR